MNNQNEEINLSIEYLNDNKHVLNLKEAKTKKNIFRRQGKLKIRIAPR